MLYDFFIDSFQVTLREDKVWCDCVSFTQHRLVCKHIWCVIENDFAKLPQSYKRCAEFNASTQLTEDVRPSVLQLTREQQMDLQAEESEPSLPVVTVPGPAELNEGPAAVGVCITDEDVECYQIGEASGAGTTESRDDPELCDLPLRTDVCIVFDYQKMKLQH